MTLTVFLNIKRVIRNLNFEGRKLLISHRVLSEIGKGTYK